MKCRQTCVCPLLDNSGHNWILARNGLSTNDPKPTSTVSDRDVYFIPYVAYSSAMSALIAFALAMSALPPLVSPFFNFVTPRA